MESFGNNYDDDVFYYVPAGISCSYNDVTAAGPFLSTVSINGTDKCIDNRVDPSVPYDPISDDPTDETDRIEGDVRRGAIPIGFDVNFFGDTYNSIYPSENGTVSFARPDYTYNNNIAGASNNSKSSAMYPLSLDMYYVDGISNFWVAQTTVDSKAAMVLTWENIHPCCDDEAESEKASFQLVLINLGGGDFDAYFNYGQFEIFDQGYTAPTVTINMQTVTTAATNVFKVDNMTGLNPGDECLDVDPEFIGLDEDDSFTDQTFADAVDSDVYMKVVSIENRQVSLWSDDACTSALSTTEGVVQDVATQGHVYLSLEANDNDYESSAIGWGTFNPVTGELSATELRQNVANSTQIDAATIDGAPSPSRLIVASYRTTVPGRFVIGQRGGQTIGDPNPDNGIQEEEEEVAPSGSSATPPSRSLTPKPNAAQYVSPGSAAVLLGDGSENHTITKDSANGSFSISGDGWSATISGSKASGDPAALTTKDGDLKVPLSGGLSFNMVGYEPSSQIKVYAMPSGQLVASLTVSKGGKVEYDNVKLPKSMSLQNTHLQLNGLSDSGDVRSITINAELFKRAKVVTSSSAVFDSAAKADVREILADAKGEKVVRCVAYADLESTEDVATKTAKAEEFCDYVLKQDPELTTKVVVREPFKKDMDKRVALRLRG